MIDTLPPRRVLRAKLARSIQLGAPDDQIADLRSAYHVQALGEHLAEVSACLLPEHRELLARMVRGGDDVAA